MNEIAGRLRAARTRLILEQPFIGALVLHLPLVPADPAWCATTATDAGAIYFNPAYIERLTLDEIRFVLAHEALHCALGHFARRAHRAPRRWDIASDHAANLLLLAEGLKPPPGVLANPAFHGLSAEEIYPLIPADSAERTLDRHLFTGGAAAAPRTEIDAARASRHPSGGAGAARGPLLPGSGGDTWDDAGDERRDAAPPAVAGRATADLLRLWQSRLIAAAQQARVTGRLGDSWLRRVDASMAPRLPWRMLLARFLMGAAREDYSFRRASRRDGAAILPRLAAGETDLHVALDTSGSIAARDLELFVAEIEALKSQARARLTVHACDERRDDRGPWHFEAWEPVALPRDYRGGGGTSFVPVFEWIAARCARPDVLVYFTDAEGEFPRRPPDYPVIWLVKGRGSVPWGERVQLN